MSAHMCSSGRRHTCVRHGETSEDVLTKPEVIWTLGQKSSKPTNKLLQSEFPLHSERRNGEPRLAAGASSVLVVPPVVLRSSGFSTASYLKVHIRAHRAAQTHHGHAYLSGRPRSVEGKPSSAPRRPPVGSCVHRSSAWLLTAGGGGGATASDQTAAVCCMSAQLHVATQLHTALSRGGGGGGGAQRGVG